MTAITLLIIGAVATVLAQRVYNVPREVRRNDTRIRHSDEDLETWIGDEQKGQRRALIRSIVERQHAAKENSPDYSLVKLQEAKDGVLQRYRDQRRQAERQVDEIEDDEQLPHRLWRKARSLPVPQLTAPTKKARTVADWEQTAEALDGESKKLREKAEEFRKRRAKEEGKPPPPPLDP